MKILTLLYFSIFCCTRLYAGGEPFPIGARSWGMGNTLVAIPNSQSFYNNPAGLGFLEGSHLNASYHSRFAVSGLDYLGASGSFEFSGFNFGVGLEHFGDNLYHESKLGLVMAKNTGRVALGIKIGYLNAGVADISSRHTLLGEFGVLARLSSKVNIGFHAYNLTAAKLYESQKIPTLLKIGLGFSPSGKVLVTAQCDYLVGQKPSVRAGLEYQFHTGFYARSGVNPLLRAWHFGLGWQYQKFSFDYAASTDMYFGISNQLTISMKIKPTQHTDEKNTLPHP